ncbi:MAG: YkvA family protein [Cyanobacteria bacterium P01_H01_bin.121]
MNNPVQSFYNWYRQTLQHKTYRWIVILGTLAYLVSPIDISPDFIPVIGWVDDGILITLLVTEVSSMAIAALKGRRPNREAAATSAAPTVTVTAVEE